MKAIASIDSLLQQPPHYSLGFILAGGSSRRMGSDKALLKLGPQTMLDIAHTVMNAAAVNQHFVVGGTAADLIENKKGQGPASAICDVLSRFSGTCSSLRLLLFMPVDMPRISACSINKLLECARRTGQAAYYTEHYLPLVIPVTAHTQHSALELLASDASPSVRKLLNKLAAQPMTFTGHSRELANINKPEELAELSQDLQ